MAPKKPTVFIAAATRSGSTHIKNCFAQLGWRPISTHVALEGHQNEEHMVDPRIAAVLFPQGGFVVQQHVRAVGRNPVLLQEYGIRPIITYRNISDSVVSFVDSTNNDFANGLGKGATHCPIHLPNWWNLSLPEKYWWTIYNMVPWWLSFFVSWWETKLDRHWVKYEDFYKAQVTGMKGMLRFLGLEYPPDSVLEDITNQRRGKYNFGKSGRGREILSQQMLDNITSQIESWGSISDVLKEELNG